MSALPDLTEEEAYFWAIISSPDGLELAEFSWQDPSSEDHCYRAWDFQWEWYTSSDRFQVDQGARALGKTVGITMRAFAFPFNYPGRQMLLTAPELNHLEPLTSAIEERLDQTRLIKELRPKGIGGGIKKQPHWTARFTNGTVLVSRLPGKKGAGVKGCLAAGTLITTARGQVPIEDVQEGDLALTHRGRYRPVRATYKYTEAPAVTVSGAGHRGMVMSEGHWMLGRQNLAGSKAARRLDDAAWFNVAHEPDAESFFLGSPLRFPELPVPQLLRNPWLMKVVGRYCADGFLTFANKGKDRETSGRIHIITDDVRHVDVMEQIRAAGFTPGGHQRAHNGTWDVEFCDTALARLIREHFGEHADGKQVPSWLLGASEELRRAFLDGYLEGDGHWDASRERWTAGTASKTLAVGLRLLAQTLGYGAGLTWVDPKVTEIAGRPLKAKPLRSYRVMISSRSTAIVEDDVAWQKIRKVERAEPTDVFDLTVDEDYSYVADGLVSHNQHVLQIELDEAQDYPRQGFAELVETLNRFEEESAWRCHGVPKGVRDWFYDITEGAKDDDTIQWRVHRPMAMCRPSWDDVERAEKTNQYGGSRQNIDYRRNIYGEHGDASNAVFVLARLMECVDTDSGSMYNTEVYTSFHLSDERLPQGDGVTNEDRWAAIESMLEVPGSHFHGYSQRALDPVTQKQAEVGAPDGYSAYWAGMDVGVTNHPSEILVFGQRKKTDTLELLLRLNLQRVPPMDQEFIVKWVFRTYGPKLKAFGIDKTGVGFPIWDNLQRDPAVGKRIFGFNFSEKRVAAFEDRELKDGETMKDLAIVRYAVESATDWLRNDYVEVKLAVGRRLRLPYDKEILLEFQGQTYMTISDSGGPYGSRKQYSGSDSYHTLDAAKMMTAARHIPPLEDRLNEKPVQQAVYDVFLGAA